MLSKKTAFIPPIMPKVNSLFEKANMVTPKAHTVSNPPPITSFGSKVQFLDALKNINQKWQDTYKQTGTGLIEFNIKPQDKAPPPADIFAKYPSNS